jgi:hypothetical protein
VCSWFVEVTGIIVAQISGQTLLRYESTLDICCNLVNGWVSIEGTGDPLCWFMWAGSTTGDNSDCVIDPYSGLRCGTGQHYPDLSICLANEPVVQVHNRSWGRIKITYR